jgi:hypothetical protein
MWDYSGCRRKDAEGRRVADKGCMGRGELEKRKVAEDGGEVMTTETKNGSAFEICNARASKNAGDGD